MISMLLHREEILPKHAGLTAALFLSKLKQQKKMSRVNKS